MICTGDLLVRYFFWAVCILLDSYIHFIYGYAYFHVFVYRAIVCNLVRLAYAKVRDDLWLMRRSQPGGRSGS